MRAIYRFFLYSFPALEITITFHQKANGQCLEKRRQNLYLFQIQEWRSLSILANGTIFIQTVRNLLATAWLWQQKKLPMAKTSCTRDRYISHKLLKAIK